MVCRKFVLSFFIILIVSGEALGGIPAEAPKDWVREGRGLFQKHSWDAAERAFKKALKNPSVDTRIEAYESLQTLYLKLKMKKKAARAQKALLKELSFKKKLVPETPDLYESHKVIKGETYGKIAAKKKVSLEWLQKINKDKPLIEGDTILIPRLRDELIVDRKTKTLKWKRGNEVIKTYSVSVGHMTTETPTGEFYITEKIAKPTWYHMKEIIPPDSPKNLLGTRWLGLNEKGYGIHGTKDPKSIGAAASHGCIRMHNYDVEELFPWIALGTPVRIQN